MDVIISERWSKGNKKMKKIVLICLTSLLAGLAVFGGGCASSSALSKEASQQLAEDYVKAGATYQFDGLANTFQTTQAEEITGRWEFTIEFDSRHAGYGDRTDQMLAQVITHHIAKVRVENGKVTSAVLDDTWDITQQALVSDFEVRTAPIHEVEVFFMESNPVQVGVRIKLGLSDGCAAFHDAVVTRDGNTVNIAVTTQHPKDKMCPAIYTYYETSLNLGTTFTQGVTYTLNVNDHITTFDYY